MRLLHFLCKGSYTRCEEICVVDDGSAVSVTSGVDSEFDKHGQKEIYLEILISNLSTFTSCLGVNCAPRIGSKKNTSTYLEASKMRRWGMGVCKCNGVSLKRNEQYT